MLRRRLVILAIAVAALAVSQPARLLAQGTVTTQPIDPFGQEIVLAEKTIVFTTGSGDWDTAYETLTEAFKTIQAFLEKRGMKATGPAMTIYTAMDDTSFNFQAAVPVASLRSSHQAAAPRSKAPTSNSSTMSVPPGSTTWPSRRQDSSSGSTWWRETTATAAANEPAGSSRSARATARTSSLSDLGSIATTS
jgi:hypothetical protein